MMRIIFTDLHPFERAKQYVAGQTIATPNPRAAQALGVLPFNLIELALQTLERNGLKIAPPLAARRALQSAIKETLEISDSFSAARAVAPTLQKIFRAGLDLEALECAASIRARRLAKLARNYQARLRESQYVDIDEVLWEAIRLKPVRLPLLVYGYPRLSGDEAAFIDAAADEESVLTIPYADHPLFADNLDVIRFFEKQNWRIADCGLRADRNSDVKNHTDLKEAEKRLSVDLNPFQSAIRNPQSAIDKTVQAHVYTNLEAEVRGVLSQVRYFLNHGGLQFSDIAMVVRDESIYVPSILAVAWEYSVPVRIFYETPLNETRIGAWLELLFGAVSEKLPHQSALRLFNHPFGCDMSDGQVMEASKKRVSGIKAWSKLLGADLTHFAWPESETRKVLADRLEELIRATDLARKVEPSERDRIALSVFRNNLSAAAMPEDETVSVKDFFDELSEALSILASPVQPGEGIELHIPFMMHGGRRRCVFILGMAEQIMPEIAADDPMLDFHEIKALKHAGFPFESASEAARREALSFRAVLEASTMHIVFSYPKLIGDREALPSAYFQALGIEPKPAPKFAPSSEEEYRREHLKEHEIDLHQVLPHARRAWEIEMRRETSEDYDEYDGAVGVPFEPTVFSASQLTALGQCPFKWFARYALGLEEDEVEAGPLIIGSLYHRTLELAVGWAKGAGKNLRRAVLDLLEDAIIEAERLEGIAPTPSREAQRIEDLQRLRQAVMGDDFISEGAEVLEFEAPFRSSWRGLPVVGYVDRVDHTPDGLVLIDYKNSSSPPLGAKTKEGKARLDLQLPLYLQAAAPSLFPGEKIADAYYYSLSRSKILKKANVDDLALEEFVERIREHLRNGYYPVSPDINQEACSYCSFDPVCRRGPRLNKKILPQRAQRSQ